MKKQRTAEVRLGIAGVLCLALSTAWSQTAAAEPRTLRSYSAPVGCPDAAWFEIELATRLAPNEATPLAVEVEAEAGSFLGRLRLSDASHGSETREVRDASCEQVLRALALSAALLVSENHGRDAPATSPATAPAGPVTTTKASPSELQALSRPFESSRRRSLEEDRSPWRWAHGPRVGATLMPLIAPRPRLGVRGGYWFSAHPPRGIGQFELGISLARVQSGTFTVTGIGTASLTYTALRAEFCTAAALSSRVTLAPCALFDVGELKGAGFPTGKASVVRGAFWLSPALGAKLDWLPLPILALSVDLGALFPLYPPTFYFHQPNDPQPERTIHRVPAKLGVFADFVLGLHFP